MARRAQESERSGRRRGTKSREQAEGVLRAAGNAKDAGGDAKDTGENAASEAAGSGTSAASGATAQAASEIAGGAMEATRNVATTALGAARETLSNSDDSRQEGLIRQVLNAAREAAGEVLEREARSAASQAAEILTARGPEIAREQLEKRGGSNAAARAAVEFGRAKLQGAGGTKALTGAAVGAIKESAGGLTTKVTDALSGGETDDEEGGASRVPVEVALDIGAPRAVVWDEWTQFENSPPSLHRLQGTDDGTLKVSAKVWGSNKEEEAEITEQVEEERLAWRANGAIPYRGVVTLHELDENLTRLLVTLEFEPQGLIARLGAAARFIQRGVETDVKRFKADLETRGDGEDARSLPQGDDDEQPVGEESGEADAEMDEPVDAEVLDEGEDLDEADEDEEEQDADVYDEDDEPEDDDAASAESENDEPESQREEAPRPRSSSRRTAAAQPRRGAASGSGRSRGGSSSRSTGSRSGASASAKGGSGKASPARSSTRKSQSSSSRSGSGSRQRSSSKRG